MLRSELCGLMVSWVLNTETRKWATYFCEVVGRAIDDHPEVIFRVVLGNFLAVQHYFSRRGRKKDWRSWKRIADRGFPPNPTLADFGTEQFRDETIFQYRLYVQLASRTFLRARDVSEC